MKKVVFTVVTKNYIGLAKILGDSIRRYDNDVSFYVIIADEKSQLQPYIEFPQDDHSYLFANETLSIDKLTWTQMGFQYTLVEFCTAIKPFCFDFFFQKFSNEEVGVVYLDPDILAFSSLDCVFDSLDTKDVVLTPHTCTLQTNYTGTLSEYEFLNAGVYNLGFAAIKNSQVGKDVVAWWAKRLITRCFVEPSESLFTDQKWMVYLSCFLTSEQLFIDRSLGLNLAPWNYYERRIVVDNEELFVENRITGTQRERLVFVHFSGYDYSNIHESSSRYFSSVDYFDDLKPLFDIYQEKLRDSNAVEYFKYTYSYNEFSNGIVIPKIVRRLYRRLLHEGEIIENPFNENSIFFKKLKKNGFIPKEKMKYDSIKYDRSANRFETKIYIVNIIFKYLFKIFSIDQFSLFIKFFGRYFKYENFIYLYDKKYMRSSFTKDSLS